MGAWEGIEGITWLIGSIWEWMDRNNWFVGLVAGAALTFVYQLLFAKLNDQKTRKRLASAIIAEVQSLWEQYHEAVGAEIERPLEPGVIRSIGLLAEERYFIVYESSCDKLGLFCRETLEILVPFYNRAKGLLDTVRDYDRSYESYMQERRNYADILERHAVTLHLFETLVAAPLKQLIDNLRAGVSQLSGLTADQFLLTQMHGHGLTAEGERLLAEARLKFKELTEKHEELRNSYIAIVELQAGLRQHLNRLVEALKREGGR